MDWKQRRRCIPGIGPGGSDLVVSIEFDRRRLMLTVRPLPIPRNLRFIFAPVTVPAAMAAF